jgi:YHS domain-containing protein
MPLKDPICGMAVTEKSFYHLEHEGVQHYFCGNKCKNRFAARVSQRPGDVESQLPAQQATPQAHKLHLRWWLLLAGVVALAVVLTALAAGHAPV